MIKKCLSLLILILLVNCEKKDSKIQNLPIDKTFRYSILTEPPTLDWSLAYDTTSSLVIDNIMEGLLTYDFSGKKIKIKPALATSVHSLHKGRQWLLKLRDDVYWSDGVPFSAQHVVDAWERLLNPKTGSAYAYFLFHIKNAKKYNFGKIKNFSKVGVKITKKGNLLVTLNAPKYFFPQMMTHPPSFPIRLDVIKKYGNKWSDPKNIVTLGPYLLDHWEHDKLLILKKNPDYYGVFKGDAENVTLQIISEVSTSLNLFDVGRLDLIDNLPSKQIPILKKRPEYISGNRLITYYFGFNIKIPPMNDINVRKAIAMAIDKKQITDLLKSGDSPLYGWLPKGLFGFSSRVGLPFNVKKARRFLKKARIFGEKFPKITISFNSDEKHKRIAENIQAQLKRNLGLKVELANEEWKVYLGNLRLDKTMFYRMGWAPDYPDPHNYMVVMASYSENNYTKWKNKKYDQLIERASRLRNNNYRKQLYTQAQKILVEQHVPVIPIMFSDAHMLKSKRVEYFPDNILGKIIFKKIKLKTKDQK